MEDMRSNNDIAGYYLLFSVFGRITRKDAIQSIDSLHSTCVVTFTIFPSGTRDNCDCNCDVVMVVVDTAREHEEKSKGEWKRLRERSNQTTVVMAMLA